MAVLQTCGDSYRENCDVLRVALKFVTCVCVCSVTKVNYLKCSRSVRCSNITLAVPFIVFVCANSGDSVKPRW